MGNTITKQTPAMTFERPKVGAVPTPPKRNTSVAGISDISKAKAPREIKTAGAKKQKSPINFINFLWLGVASISTAVAGSELFKLIKKLK